MNGNHAHGHGDDLSGVPLITYPISYQEFYNSFMKKNLPCLLDSFVTESWFVSKEWVSCSINDVKDIHFDHLLQNLGSLDVPVSNCQERYFNSQKSSDMTFKDYLDYWIKVREANYDYNTHPCLYLKDWHFFLDLKQEHLKKPFYSVPCYFQDDWLNDHWLKNESFQDAISDYRFVYMGPKGTCTPFHKDVYSSYSWSANIIGEKEWILVHPEKENLVRQNNKLPYDINPLLQDRDFAMQVNPLKVIQRTGQVMFVPSDWMHQVRNIKDTISINHNWMNACNLSSVWSSLLKALREVQIELSDLSMESPHDWSHECQKLLRMHHGMNMQDLLEMIDTRVKRLEKERCLDMSCDDLFRHQHEVSVLRQFLPLFLSEIESSPLRQDLDSLLKNLHNRVTNLPLKSVNNV